MPKTETLEPVYSSIYERAKMDREFRAKDVVKSFATMKRSEQSDLFDYLNMLHLSLMGAMGSLNQGDHGTNLNDLSAHFAAQLDTLTTKKKIAKWEAEFICATCFKEIEEHDGDWVHVNGDDERPDHAPVPEEWD